MATLFHVGTGAWNSATWALSSGGVATNTPTAADDCVLDASSGNCTIGTGSVARSLTINGYTATLTHTAAVTLTLGDATAGAGNMALDILTTGWTYTLGSTTTSAISFVSTSATQQTVNYSTKVFGNITFNGAGSSYIHGSALTATAATVTVSAGTWNSGNFAITSSVFNYGNTSTRTITFGSSAISLSATASPFTGTNVTGLTVTANTAIITCTGAHTNATAVISLSNKDWNGLSFVITGGGQASITTGGTTARIKDLTLTGTASQIDSYRLSSNFTITGALTITGNSPVNRVLLFGITYGTANSFSAATVSLTNADFQDITAAGASSPWTGTTLGDRQGNTNITTTTPATQTRDATAGSPWSTAARWTSRVPLPQDNVIINASSGSISATDVLVMGKDIDFTGYTGTITHTTNNSTFQIYGSLTYGSGMSFGASVNTFNLDFVGRGSHTITSNGKAFFLSNSNQSVQVNSVGGTYTLGDAFTQTVPAATAISFRVISGTFNTGNFNMTIGRFVTSGTLTKSITWGTSTISLSASTATAMISLVTTGTTWSAASATFTISNAYIVNSARTIDLQTLTIGTLNYTVANSPSPMQFISSGTVTTLNVGSARQVTQTAGTTLSNTNWSATGVDSGYVYIPGDGYGVSAPDSAALSIAADLDFRQRMSFDSYGTGQTIRIAAKYLTTGSQQSWRFTLASGVLGFGLSTTGADILVYSASTTLALAGISLNTDYWMRFTREKATGNVKFFYAADNASMPSSWTQIGTTTVGSTANIFDSTALFTIGGEQANAGTSFSGRVYQSQLRNNILDDGTGIQFDANFTTKAVGADTFTESSSNAATVTMVALSIYGDGRLDWRSATGGSAATIAKSGTNISADYMVIKDSTVSTTTPGYAGANSVNVSNNTNWTFTAPPTGGGARLTMMGIGA